MTHTPLIERLVDALKRLPGIGPKSAQRIAFHLLARDRDGAGVLAEALAAAALGVRHCDRCRSFSEAAVCDLCANPKRDPSLLCIVENPTDVSSIERGAVYRGRYFVLLGHLSPLDGIGPDQLGLDTLRERLQEGDVQEVILATSTTPEGEATAHYVGEMARVLRIEVSRIAYGVPLGGELEYVDGNTLSLAITTRRRV